MIHSFLRELDQNANPSHGHDEEEGPISVRQILKENWVLARALIFFILMLAIPTLVAWKFDLFLTANN